MLDFQQIDLHLFFIFFVFTKFSLEGYFRYLFCNFDLSMIAFVCSFDINGALLPYTFFCFIGACLSVIVLERLEKS